MSGPELLPCPFCGTVMVQALSDTAQRSYVSCARCDADGPSHETEAEAIAAWNQREAPQGWQPIADVPPPANEPVLMCWFHGHWETWEYEVGYYETGHKVGDYSNISHHGYATHWQPLPTPPENGNG